MTKLKYTALVPLLIGASHATIVNVANTASGEPTTLPIVDNAGNLLTDDFGQVWVGDFPDDKDFSDITTVLDGLRVFDESKPFTATFETNGGIMNGLVFQEPSGDTADLTDTGRSVYVIVQKTGHGGVDEFAVWRSDVEFVPDTETGLEGSSSAFVRPGNGELLVGSEVTDVTVNITGPGELTYANGVALAPIPEPSTSVLAALAGLGLVARRRR